MPNHDTSSFGSVWACGQHTSPRQRRGRYATSSTDHPAKMFPSVAAHAVAAYTEPGDTVLDPMCGVGTTLVEAIEAGRHAIGVDYEAQWTATSAANLYLARQRRPGIQGTVTAGDAQHLTDHIRHDQVGTIDAVITSPPYGRRTHGRTLTHRETGSKLQKTRHQYGRDRGDRQQLAHRDMAGLLSGLGHIFASCAQVLKPGGTLVLTARPWIMHGKGVDFPSLLTACAVEAGFQPFERCIALLAAWDTATKQLTAHHSFFQLHNTRVARATGKPRHLTVHEDVLVFTTPPHSSAYTTAGATATASPDNPADGQAPS